jgi:hypothetical protein
MSALTVCNGHDLGWVEALLGAGHADLIAGDVTAARHLLSYLLAHLGGGGQGCTAAGWDRNVVRYSHTGVNQ